MRKLISVIAALVLLCSAISAFVSSANTYSETVNLAKADRNLRGDGYEWNNPDKILTLNGLSITTDDDFGIKIPAGARVVIKGSNKIKAGKFGIGCPGSVIFEGSGTLTIEAGDSAIYSYSTNDNHKIHFMSGEYNLNGGINGILADMAEISVTGGDFTIECGEASSKGRVFSITNGSFTANGCINMSHRIAINRGKLELSSDNAALISANLLEIKNVQLYVGDSSENLQKADEYASQKYLSTVPEKDTGRRSIIFGDNYPGSLDYLVMAGAAILVSAAIAIPIVNKKRKTKKLYESLGK